MKRVLITGARAWENPKPINQLIRTLIKRYGSPSAFMVIHGGAPGVDTLADKACEELGVHTAIVRARWRRYIRAAGPMRNGVMLHLEPDVCIAVHWAIQDSSGTKNMMYKAEQAGIPVKLITKPIEVALPAWADWAAQKKAKQEKKGTRRKRA